MKKRTVTLLLVLAMLVSLAACGGGGDKAAAGSYKLTELNAGGINMNLADLGSTVGMDINVILELKSDGTFSLDMSALDSSQSLSGTWEGSGSTLTLTSDGSSLDATLNGTTLVLEEQGQSLTFEKQ